MAEQVRSIVIVGGGSSGWLTACYLNRALGESVKITLVESDVVPRIGVGEATVPTLGRTMRFLGFEDADWMPPMGATYKSAIKFVGWKNNPAPGKDPDCYWHPFVPRPEPSVLPFEAPYFPELGERVSLLHYALRRRLNGAQDSIASMMTPITTLCEQGRSPKHREHPEYDQITAYHLDAMQLGVFLRERSMERGVERVVDHVVDVSQDERGYITSIRTRGGLTLEGDLFIDCSGFRSLLIQGTLDEPFLSDADKLLCDAAVATPAEHADPEDIRPYTTATALSHGWTWDTPLYHRRGTGYVYSSRFLSPEQARDELWEHLGDTCKRQDPLFLKFRVGRLRRAWVKNCVAIGLSSFFIEPLESTGILLTEFGIASLLALFPDRDWDPGRATQYNAIMRDMYEETRDFIVLHYILTQRDDTPFWRAVVNETVVPDTLAEKMAGFESNLPLMDERRLTIFRAFAYTAILDGYDRLPTKPYPVLEHIGYELGERALDEMAARTRMLCERMPSHFEYLKPTHEPFWPR